MDVQELLRGLQHHCWETRIDKIEKLEAQWLEAHRLVRSQLTPELEYRIRRHAVRIVDGGVA